MCKPHQYLFVLQDSLLPPCQVFLFPLFIFLTTKKPAILFITYNTSLISFRNPNMSDESEFTNINPVMGAKARAASGTFSTGSKSTVARRGTRIEEAAAHFSKSSAIFSLEEKDKNEITKVRFYATCVIITTTEFFLCSLPISVTTTIPKFRIRDVVICTKPLLCGTMSAEARYGCCIPCRPSCCSKQQRTITFILREPQNNRTLWGGASTVEVRVKHDFKEEVIHHYVYGPLLNSGDKTHALAHMIEEVRADKK